MTQNRVNAARAYALFASDLSSQCSPSEVAVAAAIRTATTAHGSVRGCAGEVGAAYGEHPETAAPRMRWARHVIEAIYGPTRHGWNPSTPVAQTPAGHLARRKHAPGNRARRTTPALTVR